MVRGTLYRHRVRGVSHRRLGPAPLPRGLRPQSRGRLGVELPPNSHPCPPLTAQDVKALLADTHQGLLAHGLGEAVEQASLWRQVSQRLQALVPASEGPLDPTLVEVYTQYRATWRLWEHRLTLLSLIAQAQRMVVPNPPLRPLSPFTRG